MSTKRLQCGASQTTGRFALISATAYWVGVRRDLLNCVAVLGICKPASEATVVGRNSAVVRRSQVLARALSVRVCVCVCVQASAHAKPRALRTAGPHFRLGAALNHVVWQRVFVGTIIDDGQSFWPAQGERVRAHTRMMMAS